MKKQIFLTFAISAFCFLSLNLFSQNNAKNAKFSYYNLDLKKSTIKWIGRKVTGEHNGNLKFSNGKMIFKDDKVTGGIFNVDINSLTDNDISDKATNEMLVNHLKSTDFFFVEKFPNATFVITSITPKENNSYKIVGNMTIRDKTQSVEFDGFFSVKGKVLSGSAKLVLNRTKFDMIYGSGSFFKELGDKMIKDDFDLEINILAIKE